MLKNSAKFFAEPNRTGQNQPNPKPNRNFGRFLTRTNNRLVKGKIRQWGKIKPSEITSHGNSIVWDAVGLSAEDIWNRIYTNLMNIADIVPVKTVSHLSIFRTDNT